MLNKRVMVAVVVVIARAFDGRVVNAVHRTITDQHALGRRSLSSHLVLKPSRSIVRCAVPTDSLFAFCLWPAGGGKDERVRGGHDRGWKRARRLRTKDGNAAPVRCQPRNLPKRVRSRRSSAHSSVADAEQTRSCEKRAVDTVRHGIHIRKHFNTPIEI